MKPRTALVASLLACFVVSGCDVANSSPLSGPGRRTNKDAGLGEEATEGEVPAKPSGGATTEDPSGPGPGPTLPADPNGFQLTIAPLLDAQGCTECHHQTRRVDLTRYPFMTGTPTEAADKLIASFATTMPPAPRPRAPTSLVDAIVKWKAEGMKP